MAKENENENKNVGTENQEGQQQNVQQPENQNGGQQATGTTEKKNGFGAFCKAHWKGITAGVLGALGIGGSAVVAYKKGKAAGIASVPLPTDGEDYSLNPNE